MHNQSLGRALCFFDKHPPVPPDDLSAVAHLPAALGIERRLGEQNFHTRAFGHFRQGLPGRAFVPRRSSGGVEGTSGEQRSDLAKRL